MIAEGKSKPAFGTLLALLFIATSVAADQAIKYLVETHLPFEEPVTLTPFLALFRTWNQGVAFSMFSSMPDWGITVMRLAIVGLVLWWWKSLRHGTLLLHVGFSMIISGAIGNIIDRLIYGHVVDYVLFHTPGWSFAVFNLADSLITVGAVVVGIAEFVVPRKETEAHN